MYIINMDRVVNPRPVSFMCEEANGLQRGLFLQVVGMAKNNHWLNNEDDFEAYKVQLAGTGVEKHDLLIHTSVPNMYDERKVEQDYVLEKGQVGRGHYITTGDEYTLPVDMVAGDLQVGAEVALAGNGKLQVGTDGIGEVVRVYNFNGQESVMIRFY
jgi:hypothetical protein